jgi:hypothetical protein
MAGPNLLPQKLDRGELLGDDGRPEVDKYMKSRTGPHSVESLNPNDSNVNPLGRGMPPDLSKRKSVSMLVKAFQSLPEDKTAHAMTMLNNAEKRVLDEAPGPELQKSGHLESAFLSPKAKPPKRRPHRVPGADVYGKNLSKMEPSTKILLKIGVAIDETSFKMTEKSSNYIGHATLVEFINSNLGLLLRPEEGNHLMKKFDPSGTGVILIRNVLGSARLIHDHWRAQKAFQLEQEELQEKRRALKEAEKKSDAAMDKLGAAAYETIRKGGIKLDYSQGKGQMTKKDFRKLLTSLGLKLGPDEKMTLLERYEDKNNGMINLPAFKAEYKALGKELMSTDGKPSAVRKFYSALEAQNEANRQKKVKSTRSKESSLPVVLDPLGFGSSLYEQSPRDPILTAPAPTALPSSTESSTASPTKDEVFRLAQMEAERLALEEEERRRLDEEKRKADAERRRHLKAEQTRRARLEADRLAREEASRQNAMEIEARRRAATMIQSQARKAKAMAEVNAKRARWNEKMQKSAAIRLQNQARRRHASHRVAILRSQKLERDRTTAVIKLQAQARRKIASQQVERKRQARAATKLQSQARRKRDTKRFWDHKMEIDRKQKAAHVAAARKAQEKIWIDEQQHADELSEEDALRQAQEEADQFVREEAEKLGIVEAQRRQDLEQSLFDHYAEKIVAEDAQRKALTEATEAKKIEEERKTRELEERRRVDKERKEEKRALKARKRAEKEVERIRVEEEAEQKMRDEIARAAAAKVAEMEREIEDEKRASEEAEKARLTREEETRLEKEKFAIQLAEAKQRRPDIAPKVDEALKPEPREKEESGPGEGLIDANLSDLNMSADFIEEQVQQLISEKKGLSRFKTAARTIEQANVVGKQFELTLADVIHRCHKDESNRYPVSFDEGSLGLGFKRRKENMVQVVSVEPDSQAKEKGVCVKDTVWQIGSVVLENEPVDDARWEKVLSELKNAPRPLKMIFVSMKRAKSSVKRVQKALKIESFDDLEQSVESQAFSERQRSNGDLFEGSNEEQATTSTKKTEKTGGKEEKRERKKKRAKLVTKIAEKMGAAEREAIKKEDVEREAIEREAAEREAIEREAAERREAQVEEELLKVRREAERKAAEITAEATSSEILEPTPQEVFPNEANGESATKEYSAEDILAAWCKYRDDAGYDYYYNTITDESVWDPPIGFMDESDKAFHAELMSDALGAEHDDGAESDSSDIDVEKYNATKGNPTQMSTGIYVIDPIHQGQLLSR